MKNILVIALTLIVVNCFSQAREQSVVSKAPASNWLSNSPGGELRKAGTYYFIGLGLMVGGSILVSVGSTEQQAVNPTGNGKNTSGEGSIAVGSIAIITGGVYGVLAWVHIIRAGRLMDAYKKVSFGPTRNGIGLAYNF
ncbi:MAG TPA: hypothetical protein VK783_06195 [Bacteroidia bacterium]|jgi:hypothetical protein|nr:hypothetical protein [Bacteroidia bacterium]